MDLGDHGSYYVAGSSRYLLSLPFSWIHAASQPLNMLRTLILGQMVDGEKRRVIGQTCPMHTCSL